MGWYCHTHLDMIYLYILFRGWVFLLELRLCCYQGFMCGKNYEILNLIHHVKPLTEGFRFKLKSVHCLPYTPFYERTYHMGISISINNDHFTQILILNYSVYSLILAPSCKIENTLSPHIFAMSLNRWSRDIAVVVISLQSDCLEMKQFKWKS